MVETTKFYFRLKWISLIRVQTCPAIINYAALVVLRWDRLSHFYEGIGEYSTILIFIRDKGLCQIQELSWVLKRIL